MSSVYICFSRYGARLYCCNSQSNKAECKRIKFYNLPTTKKILQVWLLLIGRRLVEVSVHSRICSKYLIIDEVSMFGANRLLEINRRLQQIKHAPIDSIFGNVSILVVGDLYQLPTVGQPPLYNKITQGYAQFYGNGSIWIDEFKMLELNEIMCQRGHHLFCELLCRGRTASCTPADIATLKSRQTATGDPDYPTCITCL